MTETNDRNLTPGEPPPDRAALLQLDARDYVASRLGRESWVVVHGIADEERSRVRVFSELLPNALVPSEVAESTWDVRTEADQLSGYTEIIEAGKVTRGYARYGDEDGREPFVIPRTFYLEPALDSLEINESFRLYFNLYHDRSRNAYVRYDRDGALRDIVRIANGTVSVDGHALRQFLGARGMHLVLKFTSMRKSGRSLAEVGLEGSPEALPVAVREPLLAYDWFCDMGMVGSSRSLSHLRGKKLLPGLAEPGNPSQFRDVERHYETFIIGRDEHGEDVTHTCDPDTLSNYFGANPGRPHQLTPVFFRREVLQKYYAHPDRYEIGDGYVQARSLWHLDIDNHHVRYVVAFLGDLGQMLTDAEQRYWRSFNVVPDGGLSRVAFERAILGEWADAERADLVFKQRFIDTNGAWERATGWPLFLPLGPGDAHLFTSLRIPLTDTDAEFDSQVLALTKIMVDSLNEGAMAKASQAAAGVVGGINRLEQYARNVDIPDAAAHLEFFRGLQQLRSSGAAHRKGERFAKTQTKLGLAGRDRVAGFTQMLTDATRVLDGLRRHAEAVMQVPPTAPGEWRAPGGPPRHGGGKRPCRRAHTRR